MKSEEMSACMAQWLRRLATDAVIKGSSPARRHYTLGIVD